MSVLLLALLAHAQDPDDANLSAAVETHVVPDWSIKTFSGPNSSVEIMFPKVSAEPANLAVHVVAAGAAGATFQYNRSPGWFGQLRVSGAFRYSFFPGGNGLSGRAGSFWGLNQKLWMVQLGPDLIGDFYLGNDYGIPPGIGLGWRLGAAVRPVEQVEVFASATPVTQFLAERASLRLLGVGLLDELNYEAGVRYVGPISLSVSYFYRSNAGGFQQGARISGSF